MKLTHDDFMVQNDYVDDVVKNPYDYSEEEIFFLGYFFKPMRRQIFNSLLIKCAKQGNVQDFIDSLTIEGVYSEYIDSVHESKDDFMKLVVALFLEPEILGEWFEDEDKMVDAVINTEKYPLNTKLFVFSKLSVFDIEDETLEKIKNVSIPLIEKDEDLKKSLTKEQLESLKKDFLNNINHNHDAVKLELSLKE